MRVGTTLVVSPHLDDAVLSLGGAIAAWTKAGERVVIATVNTNGPPLDEVSLDMRKWADYPARRAEDAGACAAIGAEVRWLGQIEYPFRRPFLTGLSYFTTPAERSGFTSLARVTAALDTLAELAPDRIVAPLGIGNHIDHVEAMLATTDWVIARGWLERTSYYEDFYALSGRMRRRHAVSRRQTFRAWRSPLLRARRLAVILRAISLARRGPDIERYFPPELSGASWAVTRAPIDEDRKLEAIARYPSQAVAFGGMAGIARAVRAYHALWDRAEPLWRPV
jgi:LmbE family N-acetylglucosaminyl deacetylase